MPSGKTRRVLLVDDHDLIRQGLVRAFERANDFEIIGEAGTLTDAKELARNLAPDVVVTDLRLPDGTGLDLVRQVRHERATTGVVVLTMYAGDGRLFEAMEAGASAFVAKDMSSYEIVAAARRAAIAPLTFTAGDLVGAMQRRMTASQPRLSDREAEILRLLADGHAVSSISSTLFVSESTAKTHIAKIYEKLGAANRAQAIMQAVRSGLLLAGEKPDGSGF